MAAYFAALALALSAASIAAGCTARRPVRAVAVPRGGLPKRLTAFDTDAALKQYLRGLPRRIPMAAAAVAVGFAAGETVSVTNVQHAGVDEGGIVKVSGDYLIVLRRGRLFSIRVGGDELAAVSSVDAFGPDVDPKGSWYDEMLVSDRTIVVVGYSYERSGTELGVFDLDRGGAIRYRATYHLRSNDYYSSRNYASRLIGQKLIFYTPLGLRAFAGQSSERALPALRRWRPGVTEDDFHPIYSPDRIYRSIVDSSDPTLHSVVTCDLSRPELECAAAGVIGSPGREFYVTPKAIYVWTSEWSSSTSPNPVPALLYRLPLDGSAPGAQAVAGGPIDQFSFLEDAAHLNVLVRSEGSGPGMWSSEATEGELALLRLPLKSFLDGVDSAPAARYRPLPKPSGEDVQNRFVAGYLLYGSASESHDSQAREEHRLFALRYATREEPTVLTLGHGVDRIDALGSDAVVIGAAGDDLHFATLALGEYPKLVGGLIQRNAVQEDSRSHGFFYKADGQRSGVLGLPVSQTEGSNAGQRKEGSASVLFVRNEDLRLQEIGALESHAAAIDDGCRASCVDWYGDARPLFLRERILALLGYELVEGRVLAGRIQEQRRVGFAPAASNRR